MIWDILLMDLSNIDPTQPQSTAKDNQTDPETTAS